MPGYKWIITKDFTGGNAVGLEGPRGCDTRTADQLPDTFRMYDDDGKLYYEVKTDALTNPDALEGGFEPLDDYGIPDGIKIRYLSKNGKWETL